MYKLNDEVILTKDFTTFNNGTFRKGSKATIVSNEDINSDLINIRFKDSNSIYKIKKKNIKLDKKPSLLVSSDKLNIRVLATLRKIEKLRAEASYADNAQDNYQKLFVNLHDNINSVYYLLSQLNVIMYSQDKKSELIALNMKFNELRINLKAITDSNLKNTIADFLHYINYSEKLLESLSDVL